MRKHVVTLLIAVAALVVAGVLIYAIIDSEPNCGGEGQPTCEEYCSANPEASECRSVTGRIASAHCGGAGEPDCPQSPSRILE